MRALRAIEVTPRLPERLSGLLELTYNLWWCWQPDAVQLLRRLDPRLWESTGHNPAHILGSINQDRLEELEQDEGFLAQLDRLVGRLREYNSQNTWYGKTYGTTAEPRIAYFSAEFGLSECLPIYSGGLGILAGDHLKSASDLGVPIVGLGLLYQKGYFQQYLNADGWQQETYPSNDFYNLPIVPLHTVDGKPLRVTVGFPGREVVAQIWDARIGRVRLLLLDTNIADNAHADRAITAELYGGDHIRRIEQEIILGIGGVRALRAMGWHCMVAHLNEGHSAFCALERTRLFKEEQDLPLDEAMELVRKSTIFTTHTPVPAGIDQFRESEMREYFGSYADSLGISWDDFMALGRLSRDDARSVFNMAALTLNLSHRANGVSEMHGGVARAMWRQGWPEVPPEEVPIDAITNSVHVRSWLSYEMATLFDRYLGPAWVEKPADQSVWKGIDAIPDEELWRTHERRRERLVALARRRLVGHLERRGVLDHEIQIAREVLNPTVLTIGFARRFASYKRAGLLFRDPERIGRLLTSSENPVQVIVAGKAHPHDHDGKELIKQIVHFALHPDMRRRIVFLEDYDIALARSLVQGVDLWLNTPRRPMEASGTSGMKALFNGALNASILDGWWAESYARERGWAIDAGEDYDDSDLQDEVESNALYHLLEEEIVPLFYERGSNGLPRGWIAKMKASMRDLCPRLNSNRMVREYAEKFYLPALTECERLTEEPGSLTDLCRWKKKMRQHWDELAITGVKTLNHDRVTVGHAFTVQATVALGELSPDDVSVQLYIGNLSVDDEIVDARTIDMSDPQRTDDGRWTFRASTSRPQSGRYGYSVRLLPSHPAQSHHLELRLIRWPSEQLVQLD
jgi:starch phosphorylase